MSSLKLLAIFFYDKISQIRQGIDNASLSPPSYTEFQGECLSDFRCVTEVEVRSIIIASPSKSCCLDPIPTPLLMKHLDSTVGTITSIINESLSSGSVPDSFKHAVVRPLLKKQNISQKTIGLCQICHFCQQFWRRLY